MKPTQKTLGALMVLYLFCTGCQQKENLIPVVEEEPVLVPVKDFTPIALPPDDFGKYVKEGRRKEAETCAINFLKANKMMERLFVETFLQSEIAGLPGFRGDTGARTDCPEASLSDANNYPTTMTLDYSDGCNPVTGTGLEIAGILELDFSGPIEEVGTMITVRPQDNFTIAGKDIDVSSSNALTLECLDIGMYNLIIADNENISMTEPNGSITTVTDVDPDNILLYDDNGTNDGPLEILDDTFTFFFADMVTECGNGSSLAITAEEEIVYSLTCQCIQDGIIKTFEGRDLVQEIDFGYPAEEGAEGVCDDEIEVTTYFDERSSTTEIIPCPEA